MPWFRESGHEGMASKDKPISLMNFESYSNYHQFCSGTNPNRGQFLRKLARLNICDWVRIRKPWNKHFLHSWCVWIQRQSLSWASQYCYTLPHHRNTMHQIMIRTTLFQRKKIYYNWNLLRGTMPANRTITARRKHWGASIKHIVMKQRCDCDCDLGTEHWRAWIMNRVKGAATTLNIQLQGKP